jgi:plasmid maintenance system antidote protein VapI
MPRTTTERLRTALPELLAEQAMSYRALAADVDVNESHVSRVIAGKVAASGEFAGRVAEALGLPTDYFPDYREAKAIEAIKNDPALRDHVYSGLGRRRQARKRR